MINFCNHFMLMCMNKINKIRDHTRQTRRFSVVIAHVHSCYFSLSCALCVLIMRQRNDDSTNNYLLFIKSINKCPANLYSTIDVCCVWLIDWWGLYLTKYTGEWHWFNFVSVGVDGKASHPFSGYLQIWIEIQSSFDFKKKSF